MFVKNKRMVLQNNICNTYKEWHKDLLTDEEKDRKINAIKREQYELLEVELDLKTSFKSVVLYIICVFILFLTFKVWNSLNEILLETTFDKVMNILGNIAFGIGAIYIVVNLIRSIIWCIQDIRELYFI